ncbi:TBC1 domain family member 14 isoform X4 [Phodopus roborovskii]|uniref:TBC1 domain family member 14 isoform X4 n=1 Tax=Phodopus roborovskii TaxID=109678 RepID=UPI0021E4AEAF|nr:TBC1 domain family member 14 isoform X4 [Phodopus roborovskii]
MRLYLDHFWALMTKVSSWTKMTDGNLSTSMNGVSLMGILDGRPGDSLQDLQHLNVKAPRSVSVPDYGPTLKLGALEDRHSLQSVDSGIPTLEIGNPEPVPCSVVHVKRKQSESEVIPERAFQSACPLPSCAPLAPTSSEQEQVVRKSSTFPRTGYDSVKLYSPTSKALSRSDNVSVCSVSSLGTELSTTLSVSNEDILDLMVTSSSSAIVTLENDDDRHFTDVTLSSIKETSDLHQQDCVAETEEGRKLKLFQPFSHFFTRNLLARKQNARLDRQRDLGWKLFGKVPLRETAQKDSKKTQKEYEDKAGRPPSPKQNVRKNLDFEPLSTTALILEDRPANLPAKPAEEAQKHRQQYEEMVVQAKKRELKEAQRRKKQLEERCKVEESIGNAVLTWNNEILPNWETMWCSKKVRDLWWQGIPPSVRGKVWSLAIGNELNITHELFDICLARAKERWRSLSTGGSEAENEDAGFSAADREASLELIKLDISRTFPNLCIFQQDLHLVHAQFLTRLPEDLPADEVFAAISTVQMQSRNKKWAQVLSALQKDSREMEKGSPSLRH